MNTVLHVCSNARYTWIHTRWILRLVFSSLLLVVLLLLGFFFVLHSFSSSFHVRLFKFYANLNGCTALCSTQNIFQFVYYITLHWMLFMKVDKLSAWACARSLISQYALCMMRNLDKGKKTTKLDDDEVMNNNGILWRVNFLQWKITKFPFIRKWDSILSVRNAQVFLLFFSFATASIIKFFFVSKDKHIKFYWFV